MYGIPGPSTSNGPAPKMTKEEVNTVRKEKKFDEDTRKRLEQLYGPSKDSRTRVQLTRPFAKRYTCPTCQKTSSDIRRVCGQCLSPEPGSLTRNLMDEVRDERMVHENVNGEPTVRTSPKKEILLGSCSVTSYKGNACKGALEPAPGGGASVLTTPLTQRRYRVVSVTTGFEGGYCATKSAAPAPHRNGEPRSEAPQRHVSGGRQRTGNDEDEPGCEISEGAMGYGGGQDEVAGESSLEAPSSATRYVDPQTTQSAKDTHCAVRFPPFATNTTLGKASASPASLPRRNPNKPDFTHFIAIPIGSLSEVRPQLENLVECMKAVSGATEPAAETSIPEAGGNEKLSGPITPELFNSLDRLHLTLLMLSLHTPQQLKFAKDLLQSFADAWALEKKKLMEDPILQQHFRNVSSCGLSSCVKPLIRLGGLYVMPSRQQQNRAANAKASSSSAQQLDELAPLPYEELQKGVDVSKAAVVFMGVDDAASQYIVHRIQSVVQRVFSELLVELQQTEDEKASDSLVHMTILNKKWRSTAAKRPFDARYLLEVFKGQCQIGRGEDNVDVRSYNGFAIQEVVLLRRSNTHHKGQSGRVAGAESESHIREAAVPL